MPVPAGSWDGLRRVKINRLAESDAANRTSLVAGSVPKARGWKPNWGRRHVAIDSSPCLLGRRFEHHGNVTGATARADEPGFQAGQGEVRSPGHHQRLNIQLCPKHASPGAVGVVHTALRTARMNAPAERIGLSERFDRHGNKMRTYVGLVKHPCAHSARPRSRRKFSRLAGFARPCR